MTEDSFGFDEIDEDITPDIEIPDIDLEDYEVPEDEETAVEDEAGGSQVFAWIGSGQGGGRLAKAFYDRGRSTGTTWITSSSVSVPVEEAAAVQQTSSSKWQRST